MMHFQVADIHRPLLSLSQAADQGFWSHLDYSGGWLEDTRSGEIIPIQRRGISTSFKFGSEQVQMRVLLIPTRVLPGGDDTGSRRSGSHKTK